MKGKAIRHDGKPGAASAAGTWLEKKLSQLDALYRRFGKGGLKDQSLADIGLLLSSKELQFRDTGKNRDASEQQKAANRLLELEIQDLTAYVKSQAGGLSLDGLRSSRPMDRAQQAGQQRPCPPRDRERGPER